MKIGELAKRTGCSVETLRFYEQKGLLEKPPRNGANYRSYDEASVNHIQFIRHCRSLDIGLDEVAQLLASRQAPEQDCTSVNTLVDRHIAQVAARIEQLTALRDELQAIRSRCTDSTSSRHCAILKELASTSPSAF